VTGATGLGPGTAWAADATEIEVRSQTADEINAEAERERAAQIDSGVGVRAEALAGYGVAFGSPPGGSNEYGPAIGARLGYAFPGGPYVGGTFVYAFGTEINNPMADVSTYYRTSALFAGPEFGWELKFGHVFLRPFVGLGALQFSHSSISAGPGTDLDAAFWGGGAAVYQVNRFYLGIDGRAIATTNEGYGGAMFAGNAGVAF
jgi:hypothetical protein